VTIDVGKGDIDPALVCVVQVFVLYFLRLNGSTPVM